LYQTERYIENIIPVINEQVNSKTNIEYSNDGEAFTIPFMPNNTIQNLTVSISLIGRNLDYEIYSLYVYRCALSQEDKILQIFTIESTEIINPSYVEFEDMNFDGCLDMSVVWFTGNANRTYQYYRFHETTTEFEETPFFSVNCVGLEFYPDTKQIIATSRSSASVYERIMYQYINEKYVLKRREYIKSLDLDSMTYDLRIIQYNEDVSSEIFSIILTEDEYYGDITIRDNYLRFGTSNLPYWYP